MIIALFPVNIYISQLCQHETCVHASCSLTHCFAVLLEEHLAVYEDLS